MNTNYYLLYVRYKFHISFFLILCILFLLVMVFVSRNASKSQKNSRTLVDIQDSPAIDTTVNNVSSNNKKGLKEANPGTHSTIHNLMPKTSRTVNEYLIVSAKRYTKGNEKILLITSPYYPMALSQVEMGGEWSKDDNILAAIGVTSEYLKEHPENVLSLTWKDMNPRPDPDAKYIGPLQLSWNYNNEYNGTEALHAAKISELGRMFVKDGTIRKDITRSISAAAKPFRMVTGDRCNWTDAVNLLYWAMVLDHSHIPENSSVRKMNIYGRLAFSAMCHNYTGNLSYNTDKLKVVYNIREAMAQEQVEAWCYAIGKENVVNRALAVIRKTRPLQYKNDSLCNAIVSDLAEIARANYQDKMGAGNTPGNIPADGDISVTGDREKTLYPIKVLVAFLLTTCRMNGEW